MTSRRLQLWVRAQQRQLSLYVFKLAGRNLELRLEGGGGHTVSIHPGAFARQRHLDEN